MLVLLARGELAGRPVERSFTRLLSNGYRGRRRCGLVLRGGTQQSDEFLTFSIQVPTGFLAPSAFSRSSLLTQ